MKPSLFLALATVFLVSDNVGNIFSDARLNKLKKWKENNIINRVGNSVLKEGSFEEFKVKIKELIKLDKDMHSQIIKNLQLSEIDDINKTMAYTYQPLFLKYREIVFKMENKRLKELGNLNYYSFMLDNFYFTSPPVFELLLSIVELFLKVTTGNLLLLEEEKELKRRFIGSHRVHGLFAGLSTVIIRRKIVKLKDEFDYIPIINSLKEYFSFMSRLREIRDDYPVFQKLDHKIADNMYDDLEIAIFIEFEEIFKGYFNIPYDIISTNRN